MVNKYFQVLNAFGGFHILKLKSNVEAPSIAAVDKYCPTLPFHVNAIKEAGL
jgi:hypothetical protein